MIAFIAFGVIGIGIFAVAWLFAIALQYVEDHTDDEE